MINLFNYSVVIEGGGNFFLKILEKENATPEYCNWLNDSVVNKYLETKSASVNELRKYIVSKFISDKSLLFGIFSKPDNNHIGNIKLEPVDFEKSYATMGIIIGDKKYWGRGLATEVICVLADWVFDKLGIKEVNLGVISGNKPAIRVYEKCGFVKYRIDKKFFNHNGQLFDCIYMRKINTKI